ncbi:MAG: phosphatase PAP2 family protein [Bacteroidales bacterium]|nr:phosphatase PAP2 family protein [Bacteroidales bacterium]
MLDFLIDLDKQAFLFLNGCHSNAFDFMMWWFSDKMVWIPFYLYLAYKIVRKYGWESIAILLSIAILIALSDQISVVIKESVARFRPSHDPVIEEYVRTLRGYRGGNYGFVSSHAANSFALVVFLYHFLKLKHTFLGPVLILWAFLVSYSRIYLGVHYPGDIIGGALLGMVLAWILVHLYQFVVTRICISKSC